MRSANQAAARGQSRRYRARFTEAKAALAGHHRQAQRIDAATPKNLAERVGMRLDTVEALASSATR